MQLHCHLFAVYEDNLIDKMNYLFRNKQSELIVEFRLEDFVGKTSVHLSDYLGACTWDFDGKHLVPSNRTIYPLNRYPLKNIPLKSFFIGFTIFSNGLNFHFTLNQRRDVRENLTLKVRKGSPDCHWRQISPRRQPCHQSPGKLFTYSLNINYNFVLNMNNI